MAKTLIKIKGVNKIYKLGENTVRALDGVDITVKEGEFAAIVGASGSGKTTLMNIMGCLDKASGGEYLLDGEDVNALPGKRLSLIRNEKIGFIFQGFNLIPVMTARENVELPLIYRKTPRPERDALVERALETVGLTQRAGHNPSQLSGGQQQRVAIARAIAAAPPIILADEPCGNLDSRSGAKIMDTLTELNRRGKTIVLITHDEEAAKRAGRVIRISDGRIVG